MKLIKLNKTCLVAVASLAAGAMICLPRFASASVTGQCSNCHTMHNSQNGTPMTTNGSTTPNEKLLLASNCLACHTGNNDGGSTPFVYNTATVTYGPGSGGSLAGGNFYWTVNGGETPSSGSAFPAGGGHDVDFLNTSLAYAFQSPPGYSSASDPDNPASWNPSTTPLTCAGTYGCHGNRAKIGNFAAVSGAHHSDATGEIDGNTTGATTVGGSYRFLLGIYGYEDPDWEYTATSGTTDHNEYYGVARSADSDTAAHSISHLCAECHGAFHNSAVSSYTNDNGDTVTAGIQGTAWGSPWIRHPTDFDMYTLFSSTTKPDYVGYGGTNHYYQVDVPVASDDLSGGPDSTVDASGHAIVTCLSCHRAHGSPWADLLRWDYSGMVAGTTSSAAGTGCFKCHTTKDGV